MTEEAGATDNAADAAVVAALRWFRHEWDPALSLIEWRTRLVDSGWAPGGGR